MVVNMYMGVYELLNLKMLLTIFWNIFGGLGGRGM